MRNRSTLYCGLLAALLAATDSFPTQSDVDAVIGQADAKVRSTYRNSASDRYSGKEPVRVQGRKITERSVQMEERNQLVLKAASMLERIHGVTNSTSAREMAQEGLVRRLSSSLDAEFKNTFRPTIQVHAVSGPGETQTSVRPTSQVHVAGGSSRPGFQVAAICSADSEPTCDSSYPYRTITGECNNLASGKRTWGAISTRMRRLVPSAYADSQEVPRGGWISATDDECDHPSVGRLPNPRRVSLEFHPSNSNEDITATLMVMQFGQFLDHDITLTPESRTKKGCCSLFALGGGIPGCFPIGVPCQDPTFTRRHRPPPTLQFVPEPSSDRQYGGSGTGCDHLLELTRSVPFCEGDTAVREQMNDITAFVDASNVYGDIVTAQPLRVNGPGWMSGLLRTEDDELLPTNEDGTRIGGDVRADENPGLSSLHTIFVREHNRIVTALHAIDGSLSGEELYQRSRRIVGAEMQHIVYGQFLTQVIGPAAMNTYNLNINQGSTYNSNVDPSITNAFATAAFRFGHSLIRSLVSMIDHVTNVMSNYRLKDNFFQSTLYEMRMEAILNGMINSKAESVDVNVVEDVTESLFVNTHDFPAGTDLVARNIQRGRDHGLPGYNEYRSLCGMIMATSWSSAPTEIPQALWNQLSDLYTSPNDIDLFSAGLAETTLPGAHVGPTFACIIGRQFRALKEGDRFFFTHGNGGSPFTPLQLASIKARHLGDIICDNTDIPTMRSNVFVAGSSTFNCDDNSPLDPNLFASAPTRG